MPKGDFLTGTVRLKSNVRLYLSGGATVRVTHDLAKYPLALRFEGVELMNFSPFIYAVGEENVAIAGAGTIDGNADEEHWWAWKGREGAESVSQTNDRKHLFDMAERRVPVNERVFGPGHYLRPNYYCRNCHDFEGTQTSKLDVDKKCLGSGRYWKDDPKYIGKLFHDFRRSASYEASDDFAAVSGPLQSGMTTFKLGPGIP